MLTGEWVVVLSGKPVDELEHSFRAGPLQEDDRHLLLEYIVDLSGGLKVEIFANEHPPPHFRVKASGSVANFRISDCKKLNGSLGRYERNVKSWHKKYKSELIKVWNETRPTDCPVGEYRENDR